MWQKIRVVLGVLTDLLNIGRSRGWWRERPGIISLNLQPHLNSR